MTESQLLHSEKSKKKKKNAEEDANQGDAVDFLIKPQSFTPPVDTSQWPILLKNYDKLNVRTGHYTPLPNGYSPLKRPLAEYIKYGIMNLDKPANPSSVKVCQVLASFSSLKHAFVVRSDGSVLFWSFGSDFTAFAAPIHKGR